MKKYRNIIGAAALLSMSAFYLSGIADVVFANNTPQTLPFSQNWTNTGLITVNDDWSGGSGHRGFSGQRPNDRHRCRPAQHTH